MTIKVIVNWLILRYFVFAMKNKYNQLPSLFLLICLLGFPQISETIYTPSLPDLARSLGIGMDLAEFTLTIYFIGFAFGVLVYGTLADQIGRRASMLLGLFIYLIGSLGCSFASSIGALLFFRLIQAFGAASGSVVTQTILRDIYSGSERSQVFAMVSGALAFSPAIGPLLGGVVAQYFHWRANFHLLCVLGASLGLVTLLYLPETSPGQLSSRPRLRSLILEMFCDPRLICYALLVGGCNGIIFSYYAEAPFIFVELLKLTPSQYGLLGFLVASSFFIASILSMRLGRLYAPEQVIGIGGILTFVGSIFMALTALDLPSMWMGFLTSLVLVFIGIGVIIPNCLSHALSEYKEHSGAAGAIFGFSYYWLIAGFTGAMSLLHNGKITAMPVYFCTISLGIILVSYLLKILITPVDTAKIAKTSY